MTSIHILLVEDNEGDILLTTEALEDGRINNSISVVTDGEQAMQYLHKTGAHLNARDPDLILLDVNLPKHNGHEVLQNIKGTDSLKHIPVIMLTTSSSEKDIMESYKNFANCYITKPVHVSDFMKAVAQIEDFWINIVSLPKRN